MPSTGTPSSPTGRSAPSDVMGGNTDSDPRTPAPAKGSIKYKRTASAKGMTKSKSMGSMRKKEPRKKSIERSDSASAQMEMLSQKQNGSVGGVGGEEGGELEQEDKKEHTATIKGLWKKAFKNLKKSDQNWLAKKGASLKLKDSGKDGEETEPEEPKEIDPVYSLLKCAADLPKVSRSQCKDGGPCSSHRDSSGSTSKASSPSSSAMNTNAPGTPVLCPCCGKSNVDTPELTLDFKQFYKSTCPVKRPSSADLTN